ncbi:hypothetical protein E1B28_012743 [Marasmius oreades]|uniref:HNH nuclease domain-containing protein n=1 Tax=Marasmius oreades TaxID=181124 RepID=A0A9P7RSQ7_9AGAR|nr:uncharacterized protein E1B28_012743 [Marasmius oreades]KAG7088777.1 hypothetical protein E1B28_012743 [Marasmius oreades]
MTRPHLEKWSPQVVGRCLGYALLEAPTRTGKDNMARDINLCSEDLPDLASLTQLYVGGMIRLFRSPKGPTPTPPTIPISYYPQRKSLTTLAQDIAAALAEPHKFANAKLLALQRDGFCCVVTGSFDLDSVEKEFIQPTPGTAWVFTQAAHIFGESNNGNILGEGHTLKPEWALTVAALVERYAEISICKELNGSNIYRAENVLTLDIGTHYFLDNLYISLEPVQDTPHTYNLHTYSEKNKHRQYRVPQRVTFTDHSNGKTAMPDRRYLQLHHICAKVLHLSGALKVVKKFEWEMERLEGLAADGSSAKYLSEALLSSSLSLRPPPEY